MKRAAIKPRWFWRTKLTRAGAASWNDLCRGSWNESACYELSAAEIETLRNAARLLHGMYSTALDAVAQNGWWARLGLSALMGEQVATSWARRDKALMGRFDLAWDGQSPPKLLEYNADTPMSLTEASLGQRAWHQEVCPESGQWNDIHPALVKAWRDLPAARIHFAGCLWAGEDALTLKYLAKTAREAGKGTTVMQLKDIGWHRKKARFVDASRAPIECLYKLYPWEWLWAEQFAAHLPGCCQMFIEPVWKLGWNSKGMLPVLWELFPDHPNLLFATDEPERIGSSYVKKPKLGREGANVEYVLNGDLSDKRAGPYGTAGFVFQALAPAAPFNGRTATLGVWVIGDEPCGLGIREDTRPIIHGSSPFVPHRIV